MAVVNIPLNQISQQTSVNFINGTGPAVPQAGDVWNDSTHTGLTLYQGSLIRRGSSAIFSQTSTKTVANTTAETSLIDGGDGTLTMPANTLLVGCTIRITMFGYMSTVAGTPSVTLRLKLGSTTLATATVANMTSGLSNVSLDSKVMIVTKTVGAAGTVYGGGRTLLDTGNAATAVMGFVNTSPVTIDTTAAQTLDITWQWGAADPGHTVTTNAVIVELLH